MGNLDNFTIAIPVYNDGKYLRQTLDSCLSQSKIIWLYDNASTDDSGDICAEYAEKYDHVTYIRHPENLGAWENFRQSLEACKTEFFMWLGAHDVLGDVYSKPLLAALRENKEVGMAAGKIFHMDEEGNLRNKVTDFSKWSTQLTTEDDDLRRLQIFLKQHFGSKRHESFLFHAIYRTEVLRKAWIDKPCLAFDDAVISRAIAHGKLVYSNEATFYARWFHKTRKIAEAPKRIFKGGVVPQTGGAMSRSIPVLEILDTIIEIGHQREDTKDIFETMALVQHLVLNPRLARKKRRLKRIACGLSVLLLIGLGLWLF